VDDRASLFSATLGDEQGTFFDSTLGGAKFFTGVNNQSVQPAAVRPVVIKVRGDEPVPGICKGLKQGIEGMRVGGVRTISVPPELGFGDIVVRSPYAVIPAGSTLVYEVKMLRLSDSGIEALYKDISGCGLGGANTVTSGCADIVPVE
jgi:hypothetical protein